MPPMVRGLLIGQYPWPPIAALPDLAWSIRCPCGPATIGPGDA
jgi:hypothetical protein